MKRNILLVAVFAMLAAFAASRVYAATIVNDQDFPISGSVGNPCTHNIDTVSGTEHLHASVTLSPSGTVHLDSLVHTSDFKLLDPTVGQCSGQASASASIDTTTSALPFTETEHATIQFECPGPANNFSLDLQIHITINADGTVTAAFDNFDVVCQ